MRITGLELSGFRNLQETRASYSGQAIFFHGANGAGKTSLLEALGLLPAVRSFRTAERKALIAWGGREAIIRIGLEHPQEGEVSVGIRLRGTKCEVVVDGERVTRMGDFLGRYPVVALTSQDNQLLRGSPQLRRRFLDLTLASSEGAYLKTLRDYHRALEARNRALREDETTATVKAFEPILAQTGMVLMATRQAAVENLAQCLQRTYANFAEAEEAPVLTHRPNLQAEDEGAYRAILEQQRPRDTALQTTSKGPHRDDLQFGLKGHEAREFASEGQQRGLVLALRLAQAALLEDSRGVRPVLLCDDVLGELDNQRRQRFWTALPSGTQVFASGTSIPERAPGHSWETFSVKEGILSRT